VLDRRSDEQLVVATLAGGREAFGELVARHRESVFALAKGGLRDAEAASDATQEAFLKAYLSLSSLRDPARFGAWVRRIAERLVITAARRPRREVLTAGLSVECEGCTERELVERADLERRMRHDLATLREPTRSALILHHVDGYSHAEIADRLGLTRSAVKTRLSRARGLLRRRRGRVSPLRSRAPMKAVDTQTGAAGADRASAKMDTASTADGAGDLARGAGGQARQPAREREPDVVAMKE